MNTNSKSSIYLPLILSLVFAAGIFGGFYLQKYSLFTGGTFSLQRGPAGNSIEELIRFVNDNYVDSVDMDMVREEALRGMLLSLDPHSQFIPAREYHNAIDPLVGNFEGIGVQFRIEKDTILVLNTIPGGPSEKAGLLAGDRIIKVDGNNVAGIKITNDDVLRKLKGPKGTKVKVSIMRRSIGKLLDFVITRDVIPTWSIDASFAANKETGYVKLGKFSATTTDELVKVLKDFKQQGIKKLILDLRGNTGGYLEEAIHVADQFLPSKKLIVYTQGLHRPKQSAYATSRGEWDDLPVVILIDEGSASASEIVAGAIQDNDRGTIIGRRSFGKGLVQEQVNLSDGSSIRLTVARYYTPTGRCIQKPYDKGADSYYMEYYHRFSDGEVESADSVKQNDSLKYTTPGGKTVYGGGGIMPDIFIPIEKDPSQKFYNLSVNQGTLYQFAFEYTDRNRSKLRTSDDYAVFDKTFTVSQELYNEYSGYALKNGISATPAEIAYSRGKVSELMKAYIIRNLYDDKGFYPVYLRSDSGYRKALEVLK